MVSVTHGDVILSDVAPAGFYSLEFEYLGERHHAHLTRGEIQGALSIINEHKALWDEEKRQEVGFAGNGHTYILGMADADVIPKTGVLLGNYLRQFPQVRILFYFHTEEIAALI